MSPAFITHRSLFCILHSAFCIPSMTRTVRNLSSLSWQLGQVARQPFAAAPADDRAAVAEWLPARIPSDVRADLIAAGRIPPVETPEGIAAGGWVDDCDWWYRVQLPDALPEGDQVILEADGIDYYSAIWLDDRLLATHAGMFSRQVVPLSPWANAAGPHELAIRVWGGGALPRLPNPPWRRAVRWLVARLSPGTEYFPDRMAVPKAQFGFGWDFAPRLLSAGIWDDLRLVILRGAYIEDLWAWAEPLTEADDPTPARFHVRAAVRMTRQVEAEVKVEVEVEAEDKDKAEVFPLWPESDQAFPLWPVSDRARPGSGELHALAGLRPSQAGEARTASAVLCTPLAVCLDPRPSPDLNLNLNLDLASSRRWWPWEQGEQSLYRVRVRLQDKDGVLDEAEVVTGVRSVRREPLPGGAPWQFVVNGRPIFLRGANWAPADILPGRVRDEDYDRLLAQARAAGINFLRVWGGGVREKRAFWERCDRLGLMVWQEFPLACAFLDHYPRDPAYLDALTHEARGIVRSLRHHPSLIAWCGGNEINPRREKLPLQVIADVLAQEDPTRPFIPASPSDGEQHDWSVWHGFAPWPRLAETQSPFLSEFGLQALPDPLTIAEMFGVSTPRSLDDPRWTGRKAQLAKLQHYAGPKAESGPSTGPSRPPAVPEPRSAVSGQRSASAELGLAAAIAATQRAQAAALQVGIEACRMRRLPAPTRPLPHSDVLRTNGRMGEWEKGEHGEVGACGGVAFWQFNEPWPAVSWSVIDRAGRPKAAYHMLCRSFQPLLIAARFPWRRYRAGDTFRAEIWAVNDLPRGWDGCRVQAELDGAAIWSANGVEIGPASARHIAMWSHRLDGPPQELTLQLACGDAVLTSNRYDLAVHLSGPQPLRPRLTRWLADWLVGG
jgi:beta-mannosidase